MRTLTKLFVISLVVLPPVTAYADAKDDQQLVESLIQSWTARENSLRSCEFEWTVRRFTSADMNRILSAEPGNENHPQEGTTHSHDYSLSLDGTKLRFGFTKMVWSAKEQKFSKTSYLSVFDGETAKTLWPERVDIPFPHGTIYAERQHRDIAIIPLAPVMLACRPFGYGNPGIAFPADHIRKSSTVEALGDQQVIRLRQQNGDRLLEAWVDGKRFVYTRFVISSGGDIRWQCKLEYESAEHPFIPSSWQLESFAKHGMLLESDDAKMKSVVVNADIAPDRFTFEYPPGSDVNDHRVKKRYVVQPQNTYREVLRAERSLSHNTLMTTRTGQAIVGVGHLKLVWFVAVFLLLLIVAAFGMRRWRQVASA